METDHIHERGRQKPTVSGAIVMYECRRCQLSRDNSFWEGYTRAVTNVQAHGLPDHDKRVASVVAIAASKSLVQEEWMTVEEVIRAYLTWKKGPEES